MSAPRRIAYVSGTRADFGLMASTLQRLNATAGVQVGVLVTGMHLSAAFGGTVKEIEASGLPVWARVPVDIDDRSPAAMSRAIGQALLGFTSALQEQRPDMVLLLGDRGEMLAGAIAALHLGIPIAHLHGGERSGTVDEPVRHAITKLAHLHLVGTEESRDRVVRMGEVPANVHVVGAPSLDDIASRPDRARADVLAKLGLPADARYVLVLFHPVVQEAAQAGEQADALLQALRETAGDRHIVWLAPNADAGSGAILAKAEAAAGGKLHLITHLPRNDYLDALAQADVLAGNSSSGIIEAASSGTPVVNIGSRQRLRQRNANTLECEADRASIAGALRRALDRGRFAPANVYGDGHAGERIAKLLAGVPLPPELLDKANAY
ncbi:UDP-N-acetylglucosamine 2-epimerase [Ramlibacter humi]|uniref:UDP-N-acetylglucosamine 2-epimerase (Hydrolyzing) n=1 Tax=Ramlibacter humi TaxID=2530451 RepID=A0A4Z0C1F2_9BURK|nr:UDP-N-acetylglucosamine 2-epimerase [Ramlibacter humi]TFZ04075.1 UDP-N-acetylglucosamine 2-epimerase (hydrolyzing) [Ramlibacter humi]